MVLLSLYSISYVYRLVYDFIYALDPFQLQSLHDKSPTFFAFVQFFLYFIGECIPYTLIFIYQLRNHRLFTKSREISSLDSNSNNYNHRHYYSGGIESSILQTLIDSNMLNR